MNRDAAFFRRTFADKAAATAKKEYERLFEFLSPRCESPIEEAMLGALIYALRFESSHERIQFSRSEYAWPDRNHPFDGIHIYQQAAVGEYRADFLFQITNWEGDYPAAPKDRATFLVVECDGHDFHERTKEQAERDRSRDRWMVSQGIQVLRFTGREIWRDPEECAWQVEDMLCRLIYGHDFGQP